MRVGAILIGDGIDHWKLTQEFLNNEAKDQFDLPTEKRVVFFRDSYIELHINPITPPTDETGQFRVLMKDFKHS